MICLQPMAVFLQSLYSRKSLTGAVGGSAVAGKTWRLLPTNSFGAVGAGTWLGGGGSCDSVFRGIVLEKMSLAGWGGCGGGGREFVLTLIDALLL